MDMLIWSRVVQGVGAGGIYGLVNVIITDLAPLRDAGKYLSFTTVVWAITDVTGPLLGVLFLTIRNLEMVFLYQPLHHSYQRDHHAYHTQVTSAQGQLYGEGQSI